MPFKIRTKLLIAFFAIILPFIIGGSILVRYSTNSIHKSVYEILNISEKRYVITNLLISMQKALMPGNDYIITGKKKYIDDFYVASIEVENSIKDAARIVSDEREDKILDDARIAWQNIKDISQKIFEIKNPVGNKEAARLMEEMDYRDAYPVIERLKEWRERYIKEYIKAVNIADNVWVNTGIIMSSGSFVFACAGIFFAFFYARRFSIPIKTIHHGADVIAGGNFKTRLDVKTGDEIEQLSHAMNKMAEQLDSFYSNLQVMVDERTMEIKESEGRYRSLFENMLDGFAYCRMLFQEDLPVDFIYLDVNKSFYNLTGLQNVIGKKVTEVIPGIKESHPELFEIYGRVALTGQPERFDIEFKPLDMWLNVSVYSHKKGYFIAVFDNITSRKRAEDAMQRAKAEWEATVDGIQYPLFVHDREFKIVRANKAYQIAAGESFKHFIGKPYYEVFPKMDGPFRMCKKVFELQEEEEEEFLYPATNRIFKVKYFPIRDMGGRFLYSIHIMEDITEAKMADDKIKQEMGITTSLLKIADATAHAIDIDKLMKQVLLCGQEIIKCDVCLSYLWDKETMKFNPHAQAGIPNYLLPVFMTEPLNDRIESVRTALKDGNPVILTVPFPATNFFDWFPDVKTITLIPLLGREYPLGMIIGIYNKEIEITERERKVMLGISHQVSAALEEARSYRDALDRAMELSRKIATIQVMHEIDKNILSTLNSEDILEITARMVSQVVSCDRVAIMLADKEKMGFIYAAGFGLTVSSKGTFIPYEETTAKEVIDTVRPQYVANLKDVKDAMGVEFPKAEEKLLKEGFFSHIRVPIVVKSEIVAVLSVGAKRRAAFTIEDLATLENIAAQIGVALENARLITDLEAFFLGTVSTLSSAIDAKSPWTAGHSMRVTEYAVDIGTNMGLSEKEIRDIELAGLLHDIGKIGTYEGIIDKPGKLNDEEQMIMSQHPVKGAEILSPIKQLKEIIPAIKYHHEFYDGTGYPEGLKGEAIPLYARILAVADAVDAMGADRPYRKGKPIDAIVAELKRCSGTQFDPVVVDAFLRKAA